MVYPGSKKKLQKYIKWKIEEFRQPGQWYVEPFVGGANMIECMANPRIGSDINPYLIALLRAIRDGWNPPDYITKDIYYHVKKHPDCYPPHYVGYVGFSASFGGRWFDAYATKTIRSSNHVIERKRNLLKQVHKLQGIFFVNKNYLELEIPPKSIIYCDPPYNSGDNKYFSKINNKEFWQWVRQKKDEGHTLFISEYNAPPEFIRVLSLNHTTCIGCHTSTQKKTEENLYMVDKGKDCY
jgi:DNA adenine methylase